MIRGTAYGFLCWIVAALTVTPLVRTGTLDWSTSGVTAAVGLQPPYILLGAGVAVAQLIGVTYAVLFRRRSFDLASGIGWGVSYAFHWWVPGDLTLLPVLTGAPPHWSAAGITAEFPPLVGHLGYGAALGAVYYRMETRTNPWWFRRSAAEAERVAAQRDQTLGSAPALWALIVMLALTIPGLLSG